MAPAGNHPDPYHEYTLPTRSTQVMTDSLLTDRQKEVLRYRRRGLAQQAIADILHTSKPNICMIEKKAMR